MAGWFVRAAFVLRLLLVSRNSGIVSCEGQRGDGAWGLPGGAAKRLSGSQQPSAAPADAAGKVSVLRYVPYTSVVGGYIRFCGAAAQAIAAARAAGVRYRLTRA